MEDRGARPPPPLLHRLQYRAGVSAGEQAHRGPQKRACSVGARVRHRGVSGDEPRRDPALGRRRRRLTSLAGPRQRRADSHVRSRPAGQPRRPSRDGAARLKTMARWFDRSFSFDAPVTTAPALFDRLRRVADRIDDAVRGLPAAVLTHRPEGRWSVQEHVGHLLDLESLGEQRLNDFEAGAAELYAADLDNRKTHEARHNERQVVALTTAFRLARAGMLRRLEAMSPADLARTALHPRLKQPMSVVDWCFFVAEHDDHHLAAIGELSATLATVPICALELTNTVDRVLPRLAAMDTDRTSAHPAPGKWSPREIVGHLIDSASNNHQRFVRAMFQDDLVFAGYAQDALPCCLLVYQLALT